MHIRKPKVITDVVAAVRGEEAAHAVAAEVAAAVPFAIAGEDLRVRVAVVDALNIHNHHFAAAIVERKVRKGLRRGPQGALRHEAAVVVVLTKGTDEVRLKPQNKTAALLLAPLRKLRDGGVNERYGLRGPKVVEASRPMVRDPMH